MPRAFFSTRGGEIEKEVLSSEVFHEGEETVIRVEAEGMPLIPSIEDEELFMGKAIELLVETPNATRIVFAQQREYEYEYPQVKLLIEIALAYKRLVKRSLEYSLARMQAWGGSLDVNRAYAELRDIIFNTLKKDPAGAFVLLKRAVRRERINLEKLPLPEERRAQYKYIGLLENVAGVLEKTEMIRRLEPYLSGHKVGDRTVYRRVLSPVVKPDFMFTKLMANLPRGARQIASYRLGETEVVIFELEDDIQYLYHVTPPEFKLDEARYELLDQARNILAEHKPDKREFFNPKRMREVFSNVGRDLLNELAQIREIRLSDEELDDLTQILIRYTVGFGLIEILLADPKIQDVTVNSPMGHVPMFVVHEDFGECTTNIFPSIQDAESWATKLRIMSGRPLDEADPVLDTEIEIPGIANARVGVIAPPLNPTGIAYAFRRHRDRPWTIALFMKNKMINSLGAGLLSFIIDGNRTMLIAGTRSAGKSSLLGAVMVEIMRRYRVITIEDTLELPVRPLRDLGYNIQSMKVAGALSKGDAEVPADLGIRTTLRLGDSALIIGEVRGTEAQALYEAMRVGALANVVAGTIHGDSPYGVFDRVVNDLGVPRTSFKATDIIVVANPIKSADGLHKYRRITRITEVRKDWQEDPNREHGFVDLMRYNATTDELEPTDELINGDSDILKSIAGSVKDWAGNWEAVWENILLRAKIKQRLVDVATETNDSELLEANFIIQANDQFHNLSARIKERTGALDSKQIYFEWNEWLSRHVIKRKEGRYKTERRESRHGRK
ncbi:type II/IV secretion system ATPase subunit [Candidatus Woesearchaeota archaeon]|nr:type II/IV secretion system ATPase subunit [Candidatus Woesearchaeota archaeon]